MRELIPGIHTPTEVENAHNNWTAQLLDYANTEAEFSKIMPQLMSNTKLEDRFQLLDDTFFGGILAPHCNVALTPRLPDAYLHGQTITHSSKIAYPTFNINTDKIPKARIEIFARAPGKLVEEYNIDVSETLIHEMVHASLAIFSCCCSACAKTYTALVGPSGHGTAWHSIYMRIQDVCFRSGTIQGTSAKCAYDREHSTADTIMACADYLKEPVTGKDVRNWTHAFGQGKGIEFQRADFDKLELDLEVIACLVDGHRFARGDLKYLQSSLSPGLGPELDLDLTYSKAAKGRFPDCPFRMSERPNFRDPEDRREFWKFEEGHQ